MEPLHKIHDLIVRSFDFYNVFIEDDYLYIEEEFECEDCKNDDDCIDRAWELGNEIKKIHTELAVINTRCHRHKYAVVCFMLKAKIEDFDQIWGDGPLVKKQVSGAKFLVHHYKDGSTTSVQWDDLMDGPWPFSNTAYKVDIHHNIENPAY